jgi:hypothetical protein
MVLGLNGLFMKATDIVLEMLPSNFCRYKKYRRH